MSFAHILPVPPRWPASPSEDKLPPRIAAWPAPQKYTLPHSVHPVVQQDSERYHRRCCKKGDSGESRATLISLRNFKQRIVRHNSIHFTYFFLDSVKNPSVSHVLFEPFINKLIDFNSNRCPASGTGCLKTPMLRFFEINVTCLIFHSDQTGTSATRCKAGYTPGAFFSGYVFFRERFCKLQSNDFIKFYMDRLISVFTRNTK